MYLHFCFCFCLLQKIFVFVFLFFFKTVIHITNFKLKLMSNMKGAINFTTKSL